MKKVILLTVCTAAVLLSGCSDNELASVGDGIGTSTQSAIGFHVVGNQAETRATPITPSNITTTDFNVFAFIRNKADGSDGNFFMGEKANALGQTGIKIDHTKGAWDYANASDLHYWPTTSLNFYAVSPGSFDNTAMLPVYGWSIKKDAKTITYISFDEYGSNHGEKNWDVMYAIAPNQEKTPKNNGIVKFQFKHILSQVEFKAKTQLANMEVEIKEIKFYNFLMGGTYTLPAASAAASTSDGTWALKADVSNRGKFTVVKDKAIKVTSTGEKISVDGPMLFVPQTLKAWDVTTPKTIEQAKNNGESYLEIFCKIKQENEYVFGSETAYLPLYVPFGTTWEQGKHYIYTLIFGGGYDANGKPILQPINFEAEAEDWTEATGNSNNDNNVNL